MKDNLFITDEQFSAAVSRLREMGNQIKDIATEEFKSFMVQLSHKMIDLLSELLISTRNSLSSQSS